MVELLEIEAAAQRLSGLVKRTPVSHDLALSQRAGASAPFTPPTRSASKTANQIWLKWENRQVTGAFKVRGALNAVLQMSEEQKQAGLVTASAGNHGLGLAYAARQVDAALTVYLPADAPKKKIQGLQDLGATLVFTPGGYGEAERAAQLAAANSAATFISPYNHPHVIAGAGTVGLELLEQVPELDTVLIPVGGGGLISGVGLALKARRPETRVIGVQGETSAVLHADWQGRGINVVPIEPTLADGLAGEVDPASITRAIIRQVVDEFILVSEDEIAHAIGYTYRAHHQTIEGAAAVGVAAVLAGKVRLARSVVGLIISGGNIDPERHAAILDRFNESAD
jgi:threonine dehydratase